MIILDTAVLYIFSNDFHGLALRIGKHLGASGAMKTKFNMGGRPFPTQNQPSGWKPLGVCVKGIEQTRVENGC